MCTECAQGFGTHPHPIVETREDYGGLWKQLNVCDKCLQSFCNQCQTVNPSGLERRRLEHCNTCQNTYCTQCSTFDMEKNCGLCHNGQCKECGDFAKCDKCLGYYCQSCKEDIQTCWYCDYQLCGKEGCFGYLAQMNAYHTCINEDCNMFVCDACWERGIPSECEDCGENFPVE